MKPRDYLQLVASETINGVEENNISVSDEDVWTIEIVVIETE